MYNRESLKITNTKINHDHKPQMFIFTFESYNNDYLEAIKINFEISNKWSFLHVLKAQKIMQVTF